MTDLAARLGRGVAFRLFAPVAAVAALIAIPSLVGLYYAQMVTEILIFAIFALSLNLLLGFTGMMSFGHAAFFGLGAYTVILLGVTFQLDAWLGMIAAALVPAAFATLIGAFCVRATGIVFLMLTMAFAQLVFSAALTWRDLTGGTDGVGGLVRPSFFGWSLDDQLVMYYVTAAAFVLVFFGMSRLIGSPLGHVFVGIRENETRMRAAGYPTRAYKLLSFTIAGGIAGFSGGLYGIYNAYITPDALHWAHSGDVLIMVVLGGSGTLVGPVVGSAVFLLLKYLVSPVTDHWLLVIGVIFGACVLFFPRGIYGSLAKLIEGRRWK